MQRVFRGFGLAFALSGLGFIAACQSGAGALKVDDMDPPQGTTAGGEEVTIRGGGFVPGKTQAEVRFGRKKAEHVIIASGAKIKVVTPAGEKGPVDINVMFDDGSSFKVPNGFRYVEPAAQDNTRKAFFTGKGGSEKGAGAIEIEKKQ